MAMAGKIDVWTTKRAAASAVDEVVREGPPASIQTSELLST